jgi:hypothetical protein
MMTFPTEWKVKKNMFQTTNKGCFGEISVAQDQDGEGISTT